MEYATAIRVRAPFEKVLAWVIESLREQGFGVLTTIDVRETLRAKLGTRMEPYVILGTCSPSLVRQALDVDRRAGALLPCNVVVRADDGQVAVEAVRPEMLVDVTGRPELEPVAAEAGRRLAAALSTVYDVAR
jgi:uncharacterized protein (DUF302 family)